MTVTTELEVSITTAIRKLRNEHPQQIAEEVGCTRQYAHKVLSTETSESEQSVDKAPDPTAGHDKNWKRRRLAREHRELFARVEAGELSVHKPDAELARDKHGGSRSMELQGIAQ